MVRRLILEPNQASARTKDSASSGVVLSTAKKLSTGLSNQIRITCDRLAKLNSTDTAENPEANPAEL